MCISDWSSDVCSSDLPCGIEKGSEEGREAERPEGCERRRVACHFNVGRFSRTGGTGKQGATGAGGERSAPLPVQWGDCARSAVGGAGHVYRGVGRARRSEEHTSELQSLMRISYAVFCL